MRCKLVEGGLIGRRAVCSKKNYTLGQVVTALVRDLSVKKFTCVSDGVAREVGCVT